MSEQHSHSRGWRLVCTCGHVQEDATDRSTPREEDIAKIECRNCGQIGRLEWRHVYPKMKHEARADNSP